MPRLAAVLAAQCYGKKRRVSNVFGCIWHVEGNSWATKTTGVANQSYVWKAYMCCPSRYGIKVAATCIITQVKGMLCSEVSDKQVAERGAGLAPRFLYTTPAWT